MTSLSILVLTTVLPDGQRGFTGGEIVTAHVITALRSLGHSVRALGYVRPGYKAGKSDTEIECRPIETHGASIQAAWWLASAFLRGRPYSMEKYTGTAYRDALTDALREQHWDRVILDHAQTAWALPVLTGEHIIHLAHNNEAELYANRASSYNPLGRFVFMREAHLMTLAERALAQTAQSVWTLTQPNSDYFKKLGAKSTVTLPIPPMPLPTGFQPGPPEYDIGLLGTWSWRPNRVGLDWFCNEVIPLLPPKLKIAVAGMGADDLKGRFPNLSILGRIPEAATFLGKTRCIAVPSISGDGIQIKTLDAISIGRPVVATIHALRGINSVPLRVRIADTPQQFATALHQTVKSQEITTEDDWAAQRQMCFINTLKDALA